MVQRTDNKVGLELNWKFRLGTNYINVKETPTLVLVFIIQICIDL